MSQLKNYVEKELSRGFSRDVIKRKLLSSGYNEKEVDETFSILKEKPEILVREQHIEESRNKLNTHLKKTNIIFAAIVILVIFALSYLIVTYYIAYDQRIVNVPIIEDIEAIEDQMIPQTTETQDKECSIAEDKCLYALAINTESSEPCKIASNPIACEINIAFELNNPNLCTHWTCFIRYAIEKDDPEACNGLEDNKQENCYLEYAMEYNNEEYCPEELFACQFMFSTNEKKQELVQELFNEKGEEETNEILQIYAQQHDDSSACTFLSEGTNPRGISYIDHCILITTYANENNEHCSSLSTDELINNCNGIVECKQQGHYPITCLSFN
jgi:hypothetical protein